MLAETNKKNLYSLYCVTFNIVHSHQSVHLQLLSSHYDLLHAGLLFSDGSKNEKCPLLPCTKSPTWEMNES